MRQAKDYIIFPLDVPAENDAKRLIGLLSDHVGMFKVGMELFIRAGAEIISYIKESGEAGIFLDLKLHDIPATVSRAMEIVSKLEVTFATVHCGESKAMLEAAVAGSHGRAGILGVTVLTSLSGDDIREAGFKDEYSDDISQLVLKRAEMAKNAGCVGVVCSGSEAGILKKRLGKDFLTVTPGIRPAYQQTAKNDDQKRVTTPSAALRGGSDYLVIGRPIRDAFDPVEAAIKITHEIETAMQDLE